MTREDAPSVGVPAPRPSEILRQLWATLAAPLATEIGAVVALLLTALAGILTALAVTLVLSVLMPIIRPPDGLARVGILVAGPPLRYALLLAAVGKTWLNRNEGIVPALLLLLVLAFVVPLLGFLITQARAAPR